MKTNLIIRVFNAKDTTDILNIHRKALEAIKHYKGDGPWDDDLKDIPNYYPDNSGIFLVGEVDSRIVTMGAFRKITDQTAEIKRMRTDPEFQGQGYGKLILNELIKIARDYNYKELILETSESQFNAIKLYKNGGFKEFKNEIIDGYNCVWFNYEL